MKYLTLLCMLVCLSLQAQESYYVSASSLNLRSQASSGSELVTKLSKYDNLKVASIEGDWAKVEFEGKEGFVFKEYIEKGRAEITYTQYRIGATCKDGTSSSATGRGACSHHGGVRNWRYGQKKNVRIVELISL